MPHPSGGEALASGGGPSGPSSRPPTPDLLPSALFRIRNGRTGDDVSLGNSGFARVATFTVDRHRRTPLACGLPLRNGVELCGDTTRRGIGVVAAEAMGVPGGRMAVRDPLRFEDSDRVEEDSFEGWALPGVPDDKTSATTSLRGQRGSLKGAFG